MRKRYGCISWGKQGQFKHLAPALQPVDTRHWQGVTLIPYFARTHYDLHRVCLPQHLAWVQALADGAGLDARPSA